MVLIQGIDALRVLPDQDECMGAKKKCYIGIAPAREDLPSILVNKSLPKYLHSLCDSNFI